jgi:hypothetical protein
MPEQLSLFGEENTLYNKDLESEEAIDGRAVAWLPTLAQLKGIFNPIVFYGLDQLKSWHARFRRLVETDDEHRNSSRAPLIFYHAMVLSDNASMMQSLPGLDLIEIRKAMMEINQELFSLHMRHVREKELRYHE